MDGKYAIIALFFISQLTIAQTTESLPDSVGNKMVLPLEFPIFDISPLFSDGFPLLDSGKIRRGISPLENPSFPNRNQMPVFGEEGLSQLKNTRIPKLSPEGEVIEPLKTDFGLDNLSTPSTFDPLKTEIPQLPTGKEEFIPEGNTYPNEGMGFFKTTDLAPVRTIPARMVTAPEFQKFDSLGKLAVSSGSKLSMVREDVESGVERIVFSNKPTFWDKLYFEGLVGMDPASGRIGQFSPALGTSLGNRGISLGAGPNFTFDPVKQVEEAVIGIRGFLKYEFPGDKVYLQAENSGHFLKDTKTYPEGAKDAALRHVPSIGGGYVLKLRKGLGLNLMILYQLGQAGKFEGINPFQLRMGVSSLRNNSLNPYSKK